MSIARSVAARLLLALTAAWSTATAAAGSAANAGHSFAMIGPPSGFHNLEQPRELVVDLYFGDRKVGDAWIIAKPGFIRFRNPDQIAGLIPRLKSSRALSALLASDLQDNSDRACSRTNTGRCGTLNPELVGVIFDEDRFKLDLFVHPNMLDVKSAGDPYFSTPTTPLSLTSSMGAAISGSNGETPTYNIQNRTIIGLRNARIRSDSSMASGLGFMFDDLVAELDTKRHRYLGGLFWAPGIDITGRRRIVGAGFTTQFDTRADSESLEATPLIVFLGQPARVEVLVDDRLVSSGSYEAGNSMVDTSALPAGSYPVVLRIRQPGGLVREERRFFVKNAQIAPRGQPVYYAYAGLLANTERHRPISFSKSFYYQVGAARRLSDATAIDASILGTDRKAMAQMGGWLVTDLARVRAAGLVSTDGDKGVLLQLGSTGSGRLNFNFDLRRVWSKSGKPLLPLPSHVDNFDSTPITGVQSATGSYAQASGSVSYSLGGAYLSLTGSYRRDRGLRSDYSIGPSLSWPVVRRGSLQVIVHADAQKSRTTTATFAGFKVLYTSGGFSTLTSTGYGSLKSKSGSRRSASRQVGSISGQYFYQDEDRTQVSVEGAIQRDVDASTARANALVASQLGSLRADLLHHLEGNGGSQYGLTLQTGMAIGSSAAELGGRDLNQSAVIASLAGSARDAAFDVLIDEIPRGRLSIGARLPIFLEAYRSYRLRLRPVGSSPVNYDSAARTITLYPGNVEHLNWTAEQLFTVFGQAVSVHGQPVTNAAITSSRGIGQTDGNGYFQVDVGTNELLKLTFGDKESCEIPLAGLKAEGDYVRLGRVFCR